MTDVRGRSFRELIDTEGNALDFLRLVFAGTVALAHAFTNADGSSLAWIWGDPSREPIFWLTRGQLFGGSLGVDFFFLISGFLVTRSWFRSRGALDYLRRRATRIYPARGSASTSRPSTRARSSATSRGRPRWPCRRSSSSATTRQGT
jgi:hypothetical protein